MMGILAMNRGQILVTIGGTAIFLWMIAGGAIWILGFPLISLKLDYGQILTGFSLGATISWISLFLHRSVGIFRESADLNMKAIVAPLKYTDLVWVGLLPGLSEEILFRGVLLPTIGLNGLGIILSSVIFGVLHLSHPRYYAYALWAMIVGMIFATATIITNNLLVSVVAHITTNILSAWLWKSKFHQS